MVYCPLPIRALSGYSKIACFGLSLAGLKRDGDAFAVGDLRTGKKKKIRKLANQDDNIQQYHPPSLDDLTTEATKKNKKRGQTKSAFYKDEGIRAAARYNNRGVIASPSTLSHPRLAIATAFPFLK